MAALQLHSQQVTASHLLTKDANATFDPGQGHIFHRYVNSTRAETIPSRAINQGYLTKDCDE